MMRQGLAGVLAALFVSATTYAQHEGPAHRHAAGHGQAAGSDDQAAPTMPTDAMQSPSGPHGGALSTVLGIQIETVVEPGGIRLFGYNAQGQPLDLRAVRGVATLQLKGDAKRYRYDLFPEVRQDQPAEALSTSVDLRRIAGREGELIIQLAGLSGDSRRPASFSTAFVGPMTEQQKAAVAIARQKVCPVSGQSLGSMGDPISVTVEDKTIYVCCGHCVAKAKADFANYLRKLQVSPQLVATPVTDADAEAIELQKTCPVMDEPLGSMGTPIKVKGLERDVYLCCKGCLRFLEKQPAKYLAKLPPLPEAKPEVAKATAADAQFVAAQKRCPVMDEPLGEMGGPYKAVVEGRVVYLCCPGCAKKLHASPGKYLAKLAGQGVNPPTAP